MRRNESATRNMNPSRGRNAGNEYGFDRGFSRSDTQDRFEIDLQGSEMGVFRRGNPYDLADEEFGDEDELYLALDYDHEDSDRYETGPHFGKGPKDWERSDLRLKEEVCEALTLADDVDASEIDVELQQGIVFLRGKVDSRLTKRLAEEVVDNVPGVRDVMNELTFTYKHERDSRVS